MGIGRHLLGTIVLAAFVFTNARAVEISQAELDQMRNDINELKKDRLSRPGMIESRIDAALCDKYGPNASVTTKTGKLKISGLVQIFYYAPQHDPNALFADHTINNIPDTNSTQDVSTFRVRRTELHFQMDMTENITGYMFIDPAREITTFPTMPTVNSGLFKRVNNVAPEFVTTKPNGTNNTSVVAGAQSGGGSAGRLLQDAFVNYHGVVPHHDFQIGQYKWWGYEGPYSVQKLDFVERSMIGFIGDSRDLGAGIHGAWWDVDESVPPFVLLPDTSGRFQYWLEIDDGAGTFHSAGAYQNRPDDNNDKDFGFKFLLRPVWKNDKWGSLEFGEFSQMGVHGANANVDPVLDPVNGLNRRRTWAYRHGAWGSYAAGGPVSGWWMKGEWNMFHDRNAPGAIIDLQGNGDLATTTTTNGKTTFKPAFTQTNGHPFTTQGWFVSTGFKISDSRWAQDPCELPDWLKRMEFAFRYDVFQNVQIADPARNSETLLFKTSIWTAGINYYLKGNTTKIQLNYNIVDNPGTDGRTDIKFHRTHDNSFMVNFQVGF